jgi:GT2 family glycosyltransferase
MMAPPVTVSILNYQRRDTLRLAIAEAVKQDYQPLEVVVVDNGSTDGSAGMVAHEFPEVRLIRLPDNVGCAARNDGVAAAKGEIVVTIDNDVLLASRDAVRRAVDVFARHPTAGCVNFAILDQAGNVSLRDWCHPRDWRRFAGTEFQTDYVLEGASAFRREAFERAGGYWAPFFLGHEGLDLALRMIDAGYDLVYSPTVAVHHLVSGEARPSSRIFYTFTRNAIWVALRHHRPASAIRMIARSMALMAFSSLRAGHSGAFVRGMIDGVRGAPRACATRRPLSRTTYARLRDIGRLRPTVLQRAKRHWQERPI